MNPDLFPIDYEKLGQIISFVTVLAFFVERALAYFFELDFYEKFNVKHPSGKEVVALVFSFVVCRWGNFDAFSELMSKESGLISQSLTALLVAGGSKGAVKLMQGYLGISKKLMRANKDLKARAIKQQGTK